jgi:hypothetical protein
MKDNQSFADFMRFQFPQGTRIRLLEMNDPTNPMKPGMKGTVELVDDDGTFYMKWDDGSESPLSYARDRFAVMQFELKTLKLYMPLSAHMYERNQWGDYENEPTELSSREILQFQDNIVAALVRENKRDENERGLMEYYHKNDGVNEKVHSLRFNVERVGFELLGVAECKVSKDLTPDEMESLKDYATSQASDGFGESLEQREIKDLEGNEIYVSLWSSEKSWSVMTENELAQRQEMGGMRFGQ